MDSWLRWDVRDWKAVPTSAAFDAATAMDPPAVVTLAHAVTTTNAIAAASTAAIDVSAATTAVTPAPPISALAPHSSLLSFVCSPHIATRAAQ